MKWLCGLAIRLYPRPWRERYGGELEALLEDSQASGISALFDLGKGALSMTLGEKKFVVLAFATAGVVCAASAWSAMPNVYRSMGTVAVPKSTTTPMINDAAGIVLSIPAVRDLMAAHGLDAADPAKIEYVRRRILISKRDAASTPSGDYFSFAVSFDAADPKTARAVAQDVMDRMLRNLPKEAATLDSPQIPGGPCSPSLPRILLTGLVGGVMVGSLVALARRRRVA